MNRDVVPSPAGLDRLTAQEQKGILRFSVLTPDEYNEIVLHKPGKGRAALAN